MSSVGMSDILQKTLASLPGFVGTSLGGSKSGGNITVGIQTFVQNIIALRSKHVSYHGINCVLLDYTYHF